MIFHNGNAQTIAKRFVCQTLFLHVFFICLFMLFFGCGGIGILPDAKVEKMSSDNEEIGKIIKKHSRKFEACGKDSVSIQTGSTQNLKLKFQIDGDGSIKKALVERMNEPDPDLQVCILRTLKRISFPRPFDGKPQYVSYALTLKSE